LKGNIVLEQGTQLRVAIEKDRVESIAEREQPCRDLMERRLNQEDWIRACKSVAAGEDGGLKSALELQLGRMSQPKCTKPRGVIQLDTS
jgi:hypothetical protein